jgi:hypothetical protein
MVFIAKTQRAEAWGLEMQRKIETERKKYISQN